VSSFSIDNIGALELGATLAALQDGTIEASGKHIDDGALESSAVRYANPSQVPSNCPFTAYCGRVEDGALEATGMAPGTTVITYCGCGHVDDGALERVLMAQVMTQPLSIWTGLCCVRPRIDDDATLESAAASMAQPSIDSICFSTVGLRCRRIDDDAVEASAGTPLPTSVVMHCPMPHIDDTALEMVCEPSKPMTVIRLNNGVCFR
jgi:hypothetical protein